MAVEFIKTTDLTWVTILQMPEAVLDQYVAEANLWMIDVADQMGVTEESIITPIPMLVIRYLSNYINYRFCEDSIGLNNTVISEDDTYLKGKDIYFEIAEALKRLITPTILTSTDVGNVKGRSVSTGTLWRTT